VVVEADEYDRSFHRLFPHIAIVTSADADHLDIYGDHAAVITSFKQFINQIDKQGSLIVHESVSETLASDVKDIQVRTYGMSRGQFFAGNISPTSRGFFEFDLQGFDKEEHMSLGVPGFHNIENAIAATAAARLCGVDMETIRKALHSFRGVKRRFEFIARTDRTIYIDDYAHHPREIEAILTSVKAMFPSRKVTAIFQPHLFTRTRDFADEFGVALSLADEVLLLEIYPAREVPIEGVTSDIIFKAVTSASRHQCRKTELIEVLKTMPLDVVVTLGAGDIDRFVEPIKDLILKQA
jgi:UDP-N-acetylmuramate--alanine ligase